MDTNENLNQLKQGKRQRLSVNNNEEHQRDNAIATTARRGSRCNISWHDSIDVSLSSRPDEDDDQDQPHVMIVPGDDDDDDEQDDTLLDELYKIAGRKKCSKDEALNAMDKIHHLASSKSPSQSEDVPSSFLQEFYELGGMIHIVGFLKRHITDIVCIEKATQVIVWCTYSGTMQQNKSFASGMGRQLVQRGGIPHLLRASDECTALLSLDFFDDTDEVQRQQRTLKLIWQSVGNVLSKQKARESIERDQLQAIVDSALDCLDKVVTSSNAASSGVVDYIIYKAIHCLELTFFPKNRRPQASGESIGFAMDVADAKRIVFKILDALKLPGGSNFNNASWWRMNSEKTTRAAMRIFVECCKQQKKGLTSSPIMLKSLIPFCVICLKTYPNNPKLCHRCLHLLQQACSTSTVETSFLEKAGIHQAIATILKLDNKDAEVSTKRRARLLMKTLYMKR